MNIAELKKRYDEFMVKIFDGDEVPAITDYVKALEDATNWRDVRDELPDKGTYCSTYTEGEDRINQIYKGFWETEYPVMENKVTHWKPLPAGPEGK